MSKTAEKPASYQDIIDLPEQLVGEIINGVLHTHPRPTPKHAAAYSALGVKLGGPFGFGDGGPGGWWILDEPELHFGKQVMVPDLAGWRRERMPKLPETAYFELPPDWVCEILSPSTAKLDKGEKRDLYAENGVSYLWFVDADARTLEAFELHEGRWVLATTLTDDAKVAVDPFAAVPFKLDSLWAD